MSRGTIAARAWLASALAVLCALGAHVAAGGAVNSWLGPVLALCLGAVVALPLVRVRPGLLRSAGLFLPAQLAYHLAFSGWAAPGAAGAAGAAAGPGVPAGHAHHHGAAAGAGTPLNGSPDPTLLAASATPDSAHSLGSGDHTMLAAHLAAALVSTVGARWGEAILHSVGGLARLIAASASHTARAAQRLGAARALFLNSWGALSHASSVLRACTHRRRHHLRLPRSAPAPFLVAALRFRGPPAAA